MTDDGRSEPDEGLPNPPGYWVREWDPDRDATDSERRAGKVLAAIVWVPMVIVVLASIVGALIEFFGRF